MTVTLDQMAEARRQALLALNRWAFYQADSEDRRGRDVYQLVTNRADIIVDIVLTASLLAFYDAGEKDEGWIAWEGGECPLPADQRVCVRFRDGVESHAELAGDWWWGRANEPKHHEIIAYRVVKP